MKVETTYQTVTISDIPNPGELTMVEVNLQDGQVNLTYKGFVPYKPAPTVYVTSTNEAQELIAGAQPPRYDGELDPPRPEYIGQERPRPVKDNPQA